MATTTVRLDDSEEELLDALAQQHGGRSRALRRGLQLLASETQRSVNLAAFLAEWEADDGRADPAEVEAMATAYEL